MIKDRIESCRHENLFGSRANVHADSSYMMQRAFCNSTKAAGRVILVTPKVQEVRGACPVY